MFGIADATAEMRILLNNFGATQRIWIFVCFAAGYIFIVEVFSFMANRLERRWRVAT